MSRAGRARALSFALITATLVVAAPIQGPKSKATTRPRAGDEDLARRLLGEDGAEHGDFQRALSLMSEAGERLTQRYDSSDQTQKVQARALKALDEAIDQARRNEGQSSASRQKGESRKAGKREPSRSAGKPEAAPPKPKDTQSSGGPAGGGPKMSRSAGRSELRGWGFLPQRDREAIVQGSTEEYHAKYREYIERYYRAIAERAEQDK